MEPSQRDRELVLPANEYAHILDQTKGYVSVHTGPTKQSLSATDQPVIFDEKTRRFRKCDLSESVQPCCLAQQGAYIQLENPSADKDNKHPVAGPAQSVPRLGHGQKINIPGPVSFALWPGQTARVIEGHTLASNQYLLVRVYDDKAARENLATAVVKTATPVSDEKNEKTKEDKKQLIPDELAIGKLIVIKGTEVNFFIPPTGLEVVPDSDGRYVREAVSLERLEYCLLLDQNGTKRYVRGPAVVFPEPTEVFVTEDNNRKFRAIELNPNSGIHVKVIATYTEGKKEYHAGDELFITGKDQRIYFPREEHAIIRQNDQQIHHGVTLPRGEARYVLDRDRGVIETIKGPSIFLPDPRRQIIVKRILTMAQCELFYPGNSQALEYNRSLSKAHTQQAAAAAVAETTRKVRSLEAYGSVLNNSSNAMYSANLSDAVPTSASFSGGKSIIGDSFTQTTEYHQPQSITIDNKFEGAVTISPWTGYAVMVKNKAGERKVVVGPNTHILEFDDELELLALSTGRPKNDKSLLKTVYLQVENNQVSDMIDVETSDFTKARVSVSFRVNFIGDSNKWFNVANYTKLLTEHMRSKVRRAVMKIGVEEFYKNAADIIRDTVLGEQKKDSKESRGFLFHENNMNIYDVEVLNVELLDSKVQALLSEVQREGIDHAVNRARLLREVESTELYETTKRRKAEIISETETMKADLLKKNIEQSRVIDSLKFDVDKEAKLSLIALTEMDAQAYSIELSKQASAQKLALDVEERKQVIKASALKAETDSVKERASATSPHLIAALQSFGDKATIQSLAQSISPLGLIDLIRGKSITETFQRLLKGSSIEQAVSSERTLLEERQNPKH